MIVSSILINRLTPPMGNARTSEGTEAMISLTGKYGGNGAGGTKTFPRFIWKMQLETKVQTMLNKPKLLCRRERIGSDWKPQMRSQLGEGIQSHPKRV